MVAGDLVARKIHLDAIGGAFDIEVAILPGVGAVDAMRPGFGGLFDELEGGEIAAHAFAEEPLRGGECIGVGYRRPRGILRQFVREAGHFAGGGDAGAELLFLLRLEPAIGPTPQTHARAEDLVGLFQTQLPFQERLGIVVVGKAGGVAIPRGLRALRREKASGDFARLSRLTRKSMEASGKAR